MDRLVCKEKEMEKEMAGREREIEKLVASTEKESKRKWCAGRRKWDERFNLSVRVQITRFRLESSLGYEPKGAITRPRPPHWSRGV